MDEQGERAAKVLVQRFEGGHYETVTILPDGAGISYGLYQATAKSGALIEIIEAYRRLGGECLNITDAQIAIATIGMTKDDLDGYPDGLNLYHRLRDAGLSDPKMQQAQDTVFDNLYWAPVKALGQRIGLVEPLSYAAIYDTAIQSGIARIWKHRRTFRQPPPSRFGDERAWTKAYIQARKAWIEGYTSRDSVKTKLVRSTIYRARKLQQLARRSDWQLLTIR